MLVKCANAGCQSQFRFLRDGKLFHVNTQGEVNRSARVEHFWLCERCAQEFMVVATAQGLPVIKARAKGGLV